MPRRGGRRRIAAWIYVGPNGPEVYRLDAQGKLIDRPVLRQRIVRPPHLSWPLPGARPQAPEDSLCESGAMPELPVLDPAAQAAVEWDWGVDDAEFWDLGPGLDFDSWPALPPPDP
jgi:hypothetical protein